MNIVPSMKPGSNNNQYILVKNIFIHGSGGFGKNTDEENKMETLNEMGFNSSGFCIKLYSL